MDEDGTIDGFLFFLNAGLLDTNGKKCIWYNTDKGRRCRKGRF